MKAWIASLLFISSAAAWGQYLAVGALPAPSAILPSAMVWYKFDEGSGTTANDASGNGYTASWSGASAYAAGRVGPDAASFTGSNAVSTPTLPSPGPIASLALWFRTGGTSGAIAELSSNYNYYPAFGIFVGSNGSLSIGLHGTGGYNAWNTVASYNDGGWHHLAVTFDLTQSVSANQVTLYIDGAPAAATQTNSDVVTGSLGGLPLYFGARAANSVWFSGALDDVRLYAAALSAGQVASLAQQHN